MDRLRFATTACSLLIGFSIGCTGDPSSTSTHSSSSASTAYDGYGVSDANEINFLDTVAAQPGPETEIAELSFTDRDGKSVKLRELGQEKNLVVVMTRGYNGAICPYCSAQTARLITNYQQIQALGAEVVLIYPLQQPADSPKLGDFLKRVHELNSAPPDQVVPFPILLDLGLQAVDILGIRKDLSKPATYILDRSGAVKFAYVGNSLADRPSVKAILDQLQQLQPKTARKPRGDTPSVSRARHSHFAPLGS
jgi:peroxiredoxin